MSIEGTHLGQQSSYPQHYAPEVLVAVPRSLNREQYHLSNKNLPFIGFDVWHAYEFSFLTKNGLPVATLIKLVYPSNNEYLVESKSLKLYLNSFNMEQFGINREEGLKLSTKIIRDDLEKLLGCPVEVGYFDHDAQEMSFDFQDYQIVEELIATQQLCCNEYTENPGLLTPSSQTGKIKWGTHLLRSNCKITHQPDWGSLFISMKGEQIPTAESFIKYIVSLRNENHFHEEICEMVFKRIIDRFAPEQLSITCMYTRRGGIDINPTRSLSRQDLPTNLLQANTKDKPAFRQ
jgi:7-cyano-7-deazaguanine reductase